MTKVVTLLTDFGLEDGYVACMKGVILSIAPHVHLVDASHLIPAQAICSGAFVLSSFYSFFPPDTIHLAVVDPGVGTSRKAIVLRSSQYTFVGPDNGLFSFILKNEPKCKCRALENPAHFRSSVSMTFHGRDIFAPVAAHLAAGAPWEDFGPPHDPYVAEWVSARHTPMGVSGEIVHLDRFGNGITNITRQDLENFPEERDLSTSVRGWSLSIVPGTYAQMEKDRPFALWGSSDHLEIACNQGSAARMLELSPGTPVHVRKTRR
ncbi:MAG: SAM-dependent chlorinase/fluorinase [Deltaproteobacteria bacterium]|nr:SAM-dependent chlorinase/fluorinase [Deltaproteobacteria bacterium]